jgi:hypothetical protein
MISVALSGQPKAANRAISRRPIVPDAPVSSTDLSGVIKLTPFAGALAGCQIGRPTFFAMTLASPIKTLYHHVIV